MQPALLEQYKKTVVPALVKEFNYSHMLAAPKITKVVINVGYGRQVKDTALVENIERTLTLITGQKPVHNKSKKAISNFKTRIGQNIGASVTMRGRGMYEFLYKFIHLALPRVRDFRGLSPNSFDRGGNYTVGLKENIAFPEIGSSSVEKVHGLEVVIVTTAKTKAEAHALLKGLGFPLKEK